MMPSDSRSMPSMSSMASCFSILEITGIGGRSPLNSRMRSLISFTSSPERTNDAAIQSGGYSFGCAKATFAYASSRAAVDARAR